RRLGAPKLADPRGLKLAWGKMQADELAQLLGDYRPAVCKRAMHELGKLGPKAVSAVASVLTPSQVPRGLKMSDTLQAQRNAVWALTRIDAPAARQAVRAVLADGRDESLRHAALHSVSLWRDTGALKALLAIVRSS